MQRIHSSTSRLVRRGFLVCLATIVLGSAAFGQTPAPEVTLYAGIEIGAKGVKAVVVEVGPAGPMPGNRMEGISNTTLAQDVAKTGVFSESAIADTAEEAGKFAQRIREEFKVPDSRVSLIGSSGLPKASNTDALKKAVENATKLSPMIFITPKEEVKYTIKALLLKDTDRAGALLVDIGSGNTKGGYLKAGDVVEFSIPFGSVTYDNRVKTDVAKTKKSFADTAKELRPSVLEIELAKQADANPELTSRGIVFLSGGAAYAMVTLLKPQDAKEPRVTLTTKDIAAYAELVRKTPMTSPELEAVAKGSESEKEVKNVLDNFTPTNRIAGSEILTALASTLKLEGKTIYFERKAIMSLIRGKVLEQIEKVAKDDTAANEQAAKELAAKELAAKELAAKEEQVAKELAAKELAAKEQAAKELAAKEQAAKEQKVSPTKLLVPSKTLPESSPPAKPV